MRQSISLLVFCVLATPLSGCMSNMEWNKTVTARYVPCEAHEIEFYDDR